MKIGFGLYHHMLNEQNYKFARQAGATHIVAHLTDYFYKADMKGSDDQPVGNIDTGWGYAKNSEIWSYEMLVSLKQEMGQYGLTLEALENINPAFWYDILLNGPKRREQIENVQQLIRNMGKANIPILGYNFSLAGVAGRIKGPFARGGALAVGIDGPSEALSAPIPNGMVWNMIYDTDAPKGVLKTINANQGLKN